MSESHEPEPPADPPRSTPQSTAADSAKLAPEGADTPRAFISYASADSSIANAVCSALEREGVRCWIAPRDVTPGELYAGNIVHAIDTTRVVVLVLSQHAADSAHVLREVERASSKRHPIVSFRIDLTPLPDDLAYFLNTSQWLDASATGVDRALPRLVEAVKSAVGKTPVPARVAQNPPVKAQASRRPRYMLLPLAVIVAGVFTYTVADRFWLSKREDTQKSSVQATPALLEDSSEAPITPAESIAVLPFADMSAEKNQEYMSDGMADEILNLLAQVPDLKVIARTSSFAFKGQNVEISEIAKKLSVGHVLEGSVRKSGNKLRITAQLIRTADSTHVWSESYDRSLDDIFAVQDEIANAIVQALQIKFLGGTLTRRAGGTQNLEAYQLYLRSSKARDQTTKSSLDASAEYAEQAIKLDPNYGLAWYALANTFSLQADNGFLPATQGYERARELAKHALQISPDLAEAHAQLGHIYHIIDWDWAAANAELQRALAIDPTNRPALNTAGRLAYTLGRYDDAERQLRAAMVRDPLNPYPIWNLGNAYYLAGRFAESESTYRKLFALQPNFGWTRPWLGKTLLAQGKSEAALAMVQQEVEERTRIFHLPIVLQAVGRKSEADEALKALTKHWGSLAEFYAAEFYAYRGDGDLAMQSLERAYAQKDPNLVEIVGEPLFKGMADDPRYMAFLRKMNLPEARSE
jgi:TolB-like protein/Tfp pilus assembly protein PilF